jgi:hypothetical protein
MIGQILGYREFVDGTRRPIYLNAKGQYILDKDGERAYGVWLILKEECYDLPVMVDASRHAQP